MKIEEVYFIIKTLVVYFSLISLLSSCGTGYVEHWRSSGGASLSTKIIGLSGSLDFGGVLKDTTASETLTITNTGNSPLTVSSISYPSGFSGALSGTIDASGSQNVTVTFAPTAVTSYSGNIIINSDATNGTSTIAVSGSGVNSLTKIIDLSVTSGTLTFGNVDIGSTPTATLRISNTGNATLAVSSISCNYSIRWGGLSI